MAGNPPQTILLNNKRASYDYNIIATLEAGIVLHGAEVKSLRNREGGIIDSFVLINKGEAYLHNLYIKPYDQAKNFKPDPHRTRKLLLHDKEIRKLIGATKKKGQTIVPLKIYLNQKNLVKAEIALVSGKKKHDKREHEKNKEWQREKQLYS